MNVLKYSSVVLFACAISGCMVETTNDPSASEVTDVSEVANEPGTPGAPATADVPVVLSESSAGLSIEASPGAQADAGVHHWEIEVTKPVARVLAYGTSDDLLADLRFDLAPDKLGTVTEQLTGESMRLGAEGADTDGFSAKNRQLFEALSRDTTAVREMSEGVTDKSNSVLLGGPCSKCYGVILYCGDFTFGDTGLWECDVHELCGLCFSFGW